MQIFSSPIIHLCPLCIEEEEDKLHFLFQCPVYHDLRLKYLHSPLTKEKFQNSLSTEDHTVFPNAF